MSTKILVDAEASRVPVSSERTIVMGDRNGLRGSVCFAGCLMRDHDVNACYC